jgi:type I restriction enzyme, S subunit
MDQTQLLQHFDRLAETSGAADRLRTFIFNLAIRGRLAPQNRTDEAASSLLAKICRQKIKSETESAEKVKINRERSELKKPFDIPHGWEWAHLRSVALRIHYGYTASAIHGGTGVRLLRITDIQDGQVSWDNVPGCQISDKDVSKYELHENDILIARTGGTIGKSFLVRGVTVRSVFASYLIRVVPSDLFCAQYLSLFLSSSFYWEQLHENSAGTGQPNVNGEALSHLLLPVPPVAEQHRIVAKVEELLTLCDKLETQQAAAREHRTRLVHSALDHLTTAKDEVDFKKHSEFCTHHSELLFDSYPTFRQAILSLAVQGRLTPRNTKEGDGADVVAKFSLRVLPDENQIHDLAMPAHWAITSFANLAHIRSGVTKGRNLAGRKTKAFPYLRVANVQRGYLDLDVMKYIEIPVEELEKFRLEANDLLLTEGGDWDKVGRTAIWREEIANCIHQNHVFRARLVSQELKPKWFMLYFNSPIGRRYFESASKQTTNLASINATELRGCPVPVPPLAEQQRIVAKVEELMRWCDALEARLTAAQTTATTLLDSLLRQILTRDAASTEMPGSRKSIGAEDYFAQLIPALLRESHGSLTLERLNAAVALLFLPKIITPLVTSLDDFAEAHFKAFNQPITEGSFRAMLRLLTQNRIIAFNPDDPAVTLSLNEAEAPPIAPIISKDAQYLVAVLNLVPTQTTRETATQLCPPSLKKELLAIT